MPKFSVRVPHTLSHEEAKQRLNGFVDIIREKMADKVSDLEQSWDGDAVNFKFKTFGIPLSGKIAVAEKELAVDGDLPFTAMMFKGQIESTIQKYLTRLVGDPPAG
jgi:putative polyhydroxyalkanoate system protein